MRKRKEEEEKKKRKEKERRRKEEKKEHISRVRSGLFMTQGSTFGRCEFLGRNQD